MRTFQLAVDEQLDQCRCQLERSADYTVLRRLPRLEEMWLAPSLGRPATTLAIVDMETTGLDPSTDKAIEIAVVKAELNKRGEIMDLTQPFSQLEDPGTPLSPEVQALTGIDDDLLRGRRFDEDELARVLRGVDALVSFNARFDRAFWIRRFPDLDQPWICALRDYDWRDFGRFGRTQAALLAELGHAYSGHRAEVDAWALTVLLSMRAEDDRTFAAHVLEGGMRKSFRLTAIGAPFGCKDALKARRFRWNPEERAWWREIESACLDKECKWLEELHPLIRPKVEEIDWRGRHT